MLHLIPLLPTILTLSGTLTHYGNQQVCLTSFIHLIENVTMQFSWTRVMLPYIKEFDAHTNLAKLDFSVRRVILVGMQHKRQFSEGFLDRCSVSILSTINLLTSSFFLLNSNQINLKIRLSNRTIFAESEEYLGLHLKP